MGLETKLKEIESKNWVSYEANTSFGVRSMKALNNPQIRNLLAALRECMKQRDFLLEEYLVQIHGNNKGSFYKTEFDDVKRQDDKTLLAILNGEGRTE